MKLRRPSPAMVVALIALVMSMTGGAIAAVNYAKNSGKVDGYDAVKASSGTNKRAGNLVATYPGGSLKGKLPFRLLSGAASTGSVSALRDAMARGGNNAELIPVPDNTATAATTLLDLELADLQVSCFDQADQPTRENAATRLTIVNKSGAGINVSRRVGVTAPEIKTVDNGATDAFDVGQQNTFTVQLHAGDAKTVLVEGTARQVGQGTNESHCAVWATSVIVD